MALTGGHFDICGPLPGPGVTVLEASAGTGKTFTIATLVTRMVAEGVAPLSQILVVTFTRMATGELRERARQGLVRAEAALGRWLAGASQGVGRPGGDPIIELLCQGSRQEVACRHQRLAEALSTFDMATLTTTHGFCHTVLEALGVRGEVAEGAALLEDPGDLVAEVVDDLLLRHALRTGAAPFNRSAALAAGTQAVANPGTPLDPAADRSDSSVGGLRRRLAEGVRCEVTARLFAGNLLTYDRLLVLLEATLARPGRGDAACARLRQRYPVVLVDEFQDTDPVQWSTVRRAFGNGAVTLVLIGDPKQAIYSFRGADVYAYLDAAQSASPDQSFTLERNWRSDLGLLQAYNALLDPLQLGHPDIRYRPAQAIDAHRQPGLRGAPDPAPLRARLVDRHAPWVQKTSKGLVQKSAGLKLVADDLAADVVRLLSSGAMLVRWSPDGMTMVSERPLGAGDIGVLVRTNRQAALAHASLRAVGVPSVFAGAESVLATNAARHWLSLLDALEQPAARPLAVAVALGPFVGMSANEVATVDEQAWERLHDLLHLWSSLVRRRGVASLYASISASQDLPGRLLADLDGERQLTDLGHIAELLHAQATRDQLGLSALRTWLGRRAAGSLNDESETDQRSRRLDSGSDAVQLLTVHRAKGLEFPVVYCPYLWDGGRPERSGGPVVFHDPDDGGYRRKLDVGGDPDEPAYRRHFAAHIKEARGEDLRHLYVALTRACHQVVIWWAAAQDSQHSALGRLLLGRGPDGAVTSSGPTGVPKDEVVRAALDALALRARRLVSVENCDRPMSQRWAGPPDQPVRPNLGVAPFPRALDGLWGRSSFTSITSGAHGADGRGAQVASEPEQQGIVDEPPPPVSVVAGPLLAGAEPVLAAGQPDAVAPGEGTGVAGAANPWSSVPAGPEVGTFVHSVLQLTDFASPTLLTDVATLVQRQELAFPGPVGALEPLVAGLGAALTMPLGPSADGASLHQARRGDRLDELAFELPVCGGDVPRGQAAIAAIADLWRQYVPASMPLSAYASRLADPGLVTVFRGYLTGSIDLVLRVKPAGAAERYLVVDYKTNRLAPTGVDLTAWHYRQAAIEAEMLRSHYPLQALLYLVALHRYLRWRLAGYRPEDHLGGALYLFLRGMVGAPPGPGVPGPGVFAWSPPIELVESVSRLLAGGL